ncbi:cytochrome b subunit of formate dehydrogenase [Neobacillus niacini]|nr:cytochrome b subunit of formate dehydrogenase [Neobacillus niacini]
MARKWKWLIACSFFLLFLNGVGIFAVHFFSR